VNKIRVQLAPHFYLDEFACKCCRGVFNLDGRLPKRAEELRAWLGKVYGVEIALEITSGTRCAKHHAAIYAAKGQEVIWQSRHLRGEAIDIKGHDLRGYTITWGDDLIDGARAFFMGIGIPESRKWLHVDLRDRRTTWHYPNE